MTGQIAIAMALTLTLLSHGDGASDRLHVGCPESGAGCAAALQRAIDAAPPGTTITLDPGKTYDGTILISAKAGAAAAAPLTITTAGWTGGGSGWDGLVTPADKPRMAILRGGRGEAAAVEIANGADAGHVTLVGLAFEATPPAGRGDLIRIGSSQETDADRLARRIVIRQVLLQGSRDFGQKRGISANGRDILIEQIWCEEIFTAGQDSQCIGAWNGGQQVRVRHAYLAAASENILIGGAPVASSAMVPAGWQIEDVILHKPLRWREDGRNRQIKNLLEFKHGRDLSVARVLAVNNWKAAQDGRGLVLNYTTNGPCAGCGGLTGVRIEDLVMLNVAAGISFQGYSWQPDSGNAGRLEDVTLRHAYIQLSEPGRLLQISNVHERHDIRIERSTFLNSGTSWLTGSFGRAWRDAATRTEGGSFAGLALVDNVFVTNGEYGATAPDRAHFGSGLGDFVAADLQIAGNVFGDAPPAHLDAYNAHTGSGAPNVSVARARLAAQLPATKCGEWQAGKGADCARLAPVFALRSRLPEP